MTEKKVFPTSGCWAILCFLAEAMIQQARRQTIWKNRLQNMDVIRESSERELRPSTQQIGV